MMRINDGSKESRKCQLEKAAPLKVRWPVADQLPKKKKEEKKVKPGLKHMKITLFEGNYYVTYQGRGIAREFQKYTQSRDNTWLSIHWSRKRKKQVNIGYCKIRHEPLREF
jgi:hypothetical protein